MPETTISTDELIWLRQCAFVTHFGLDALERETAVPFREETAYPHPCETHGEDRAGMNCHRVGTQPIRIPVRTPQYSLVCSCCGVLCDARTATSRKMTHSCGSPVTPVRKNLLTSTHGKSTLSS